MLLKHIITVQLNPKGLHPKTTDTIFRSHPLLHSKKFEKQTQVQPIWPPRSHNFSTLVITPTITKFV